MKNNEEHSSKENIMNNNKEKINQIQIGLKIMVEMRKIKKSLKLLYLRMKAFYLNNDNSYIIESICGANFDKKKYYILSIKDTKIEHYLLFTYSLKYIEQSERLLIIIRLFYQSKFI